MLIKRGIDKTIKSSTARFFMPGHKGQIGGDSFYDVTEIDGTDNLHNPCGIIKHAQDMLCDVFHAKHSFLCVNGSSVGLHALIMTVCGRGGTLIVDRGCHISVINAIILNGIKPVFVYPTHNFEFGVNSQIHYDDVLHAIEQNPHAKAVLVTSPTYYGVCSDISSIAKVAHNNNMALIVDEAHGAHFAFNDKLPSPALVCGADGVVQSAHKTLGCLTQGAMVHLGSVRICDKAFQENLNMLQTTSPSYLIMSSIEQSVVEMQNNKEKLEILIENCNNLRYDLNKTGKYKCMDINSGFFDYDATRIVINTNADSNILSHQLQNKFDVIVEMADGYNIVCIPTIYNTKADFEKLKNGLIKLSYNMKDYTKKSINPLPKTSLAMLPTNAYYAQNISASPRGAVNKITSRCVYKTPPCMPILCPGEVITEEIARLIDTNIIVLK